MNVILLPYTHHCFVCGADNPHGLQLRFRFERGEIHTQFRPRACHAGYTGIVHGGVIAAALDETMFWAAAYAHRQFFVSVEMNVRWLHKVAVGDVYQLTGRLLRRQRKVILAEAELRDHAGQVCASATGKYFPVPPADVPLSLEDFCDDPATVSPREFLSPRA